MIGYLNIDTMEEWRNMIDPKYYSRYYVSSYGRMCNSRGILLMGYLTLGGYRITTLTDIEGNARTHYMHICIASSFVARTDEKHITVDHIDKNRDNNMADNLRWTDMVGQAENRTVHATHKGRIINQYNLEGKFIKQWDKITNASTELKLVAGRICKSCKTLEPYKGSYWRYFVESYVNEEWFIAPFPEYEPIYVSSYGRIMKSSGIIVTGSFLEGYFRISISYANYIFTNNSSVYTTEALHRIVAATFLGRHDHLYVNHKDGNKTNNMPSNLEFVTHQQNMVHAVETGLRKDLRKVGRYDRFTNLLLNEYVSLTDAGRKTGILKTAICNACSGRAHTAGGFVWRYL